MSDLPRIPTPDRLVIRTARLDLLRTTREHAESMFTVLADPALYEFTAGRPPRDVETLASQYKYWQKRNSPDGSEIWLNWVVSLREEGELIGHLQAGVARQPCRRGVVFRIAVAGSRLCDGSGQGGGGLACSGSGCSRD